MGDIADISVELSRFEQLVLQDDIEQAAEVFANLAAMLQRVQITSATPQEELKFYQELNQRLLQRESALAARQNEIKMLLIPFNKRSEVADGELYSGRRK